MARSRGAEVWLSEHLWREFCQQVLFDHPHVVTRALRPESDRIAEDDDSALFAAWCEGRTG